MSIPIRVSSLNGPYGPLFLVNRKSILIKLVFLLQKHKNRLTNEKKIKCTITLVIVRATQCDFFVI